MKKREKFLFLEDEVEPGEGAEGPGRVEFCIKWTIPITMWTEAEDNNSTEPAASSRPSAIEAPLAKSIQEFPKQSTSDSIVT